jgi:hypothetical protein
MAVAAWTTARSPPLNSKKHVALASLVSYKPDAMAISAALTRPSPRPETLWASGFHEECLSDPEDPDQGVDEDDDPIDDRTADWA